MDYVARQVPDFRLIHAAGAESEMELPYATLHQLCDPVLDRLDRLPAPQRDALRAAFGLNAGSPPDRLMIGPGALSLLCDVAEEQPLICLIDDLQWVDNGSAQVLMFLARRLVAESIGLVMANRVVNPGWPSCRRWTSRSRATPMPAFSWTWRDRADRRAHT